jgi:hypothetical protein
MLPAPLLPSVPVRLVADECAHGVDDCERLLDMGYKGFAIKPIAKTLSMSFMILERAFIAGTPCFCADLTVNPLMVDWNKNVAARLESFPGINAGIMEVNGKQNYKNWEKMITQHPMGHAPWASEKEGIYELDEEFYKQSGGIFFDAPHYREMAING